MEATQLAEEFQNLQTPTKEVDTPPGSSHQQPSPVVSASRRTRSQVAPDWALKEILILVTEIAAVEGDCLKALSSYQKWKIIADNCTALDVVRTSNQCRRKWESLLVEYKQIKEWESQLGIDSYWSLESEKKMEFGLPGVFDRELFCSIDDLLKAQEDRSDTDPESDPEAEADMLDAISESGSKKQGRRQGPPQNSSLEDREEMVVLKLRENTELIHAILRGDLTQNTENELVDLKNPGACQTEFTRWQGDELIKVLGSLSSTLDQLSDLVQESG